MIIKTIEDDLIKLFSGGIFDWIVHGCNTFDRLEAGFAKKLVESFPIVKRSNSAYHHLQMGTIQGRHRYAGEVCRVHVPRGLGKAGNVLNAYTQVYPGENQGWEDRERYIAECFAKIDNMFAKIREEDRPLFGIPLIGAGLAKGDWERNKEIINESTPNIKLVVVEWHS